MPRAGAYAAELAPEYVLLGLVILKPDHGYDLHTRLNADLGSIWHISQSQAYSILDRLEQHGHIARQPVRSTRLPERHKYRVTPAGCAHFEDWLMRPSVTKSRVIRVEFSTKLHFLSQLHPQRIDRLIEAQQAAVKLAHEAARQALVELDEDEVIARLALALQERQLQVVLQWLGDCRETMSSPALSMFSVVPGTSALAERVTGPGM